MAIMLAFHFLPFYLMTEGGFIKKILLYIICILVIDTVAEGTVSTVELLWNLGGQLKPNQFDMHRLICTISHGLITLPLKYATAKIWNRVVNRSEEKLNLVFMIFPVGQFVSFVLIRMELPANEWDSDKLFILVLYYFTIIISCIIYLLFLSDVEKKNRLEREYRDLTHTRQLEAAHYSAIEERQAETAKIRHDIKNQLITIGGLLRSGSVEEAKSLFGELENSVNSTKEKEYCSVPVINALLSEKEKQCEAEGIALKTNITVTHTGRISKAHLCSIFSNLTDNAAHVCETLPPNKERIITLNAAQKNGFISVICENPVKDGRDRVLKPSDSSGYGMKILRDIAKEYDGRYSCEIKGGVCTSKITINIHK